MGLRDYRRKRDFEVTSEPNGRPEPAGDRPLMLMRCQNGVGSPCFFQKHPNPATHARKA